MTSGRRCDAPTPSSSLRRPGTAAVGTPDVARDDPPTGASPAWVTAWLLLPPSTLLAPLSAALLFMVHRTGSHEPFHTWNLFWTALDIGAEGNVASWFASVLWLLVGGVAALGALTAPRLRTYWWLFAAIGVIASADEASALHERLFVIGAGSPRSCRSTPSTTG